MRIRVLTELWDKDTLEAVTRALKENYGKEIVVEKAEAIVDDRFLDPDRGQYDAWEIVQTYKDVGGGDEYLLLVVEEDLYAAGLNYVFGLAWRGVAIVSTHRLRQEFYGLPPNKELFIERLMKEAVHEIGHLHGLQHCSNQRCVMAFSNWIGNTDYKSWRLCSKCASRLRR